MAHVTRARTWLVLVGLFVVVWAAFGGSVHRIAGALGGTSDASAGRQLLHAAGPILSAGDAASRSATLLPDGRYAESETIRLTDHQTLEDWLSVVHSTAWEPNDPVWIVGIVGEGFTRGDVAAMSGVPTANAEPIEGVLLVWDAASGRIRTIAALTDDQTSHLTHDRLLEIEHQQIPIVPRGDDAGTH